MESTVDLDALLRQQNAEPVALPLPEAQIATLKEACERYAAPCPFKVGDIVTPRKGYSTRGVGVPHVVLEVLAEPLQLMKADPRVMSMNCFGRRIDMRVLCHGETDGELAAYWVESWEYEPYVEGAV